MKFATMSESILRPGAGPWCMPSALSVHENEIALAETFRWDYYVAGSIVFQVVSRIRIVE
jgi:hypothetical protein